MSEKNAWCKFQCRGGRLDSNGECPVCHGYGSDGLKELCAAEKCAKDAERLEACAELALIECDVEHAKILSRRADEDKARVISHKRRAREIKMGIDAEDNSF